MKIIFQSQLADSSGFGRAARQYYKILKQISINNKWDFKVIVVKADEDTILEHKIWQEHEEVKNEDIALLASKEDYYYFFHSNLNFAMSQESVRLLSSRSKRTFCITVWEANSLFNHWEKLLNSLYCRDVIVPSRWNERVFSENTTNLNIHYIPHYDENTSRYDNSEYKLLSISQDNGRKNWKKTIQSFYNAFHDKDVEYVIKSNGNLQSSKKFQEYQKNKFINMINEVKSTFTNPKCKIRLIYSVVSDEKIEDLYKNCTHYFSMTHGEGFGFGLLEAKSRGLVIVAPNKGGHIDFCDNKDFLFEAREEYIDVESGVFPKQATWYDSTIFDATNALISSTKTFDSNPVSDSFKFDSVFGSFESIIFSQCTKETKACANITNRFVAKNICCISHMENLLIDIASEMNKHDIPYWVDFGTLLGLVRDGGVIPWDNDVDICILKEDASKLQLIKDSLIKKGYHWDGTTGFGERHEGLLRVNTSKTNLNTADIYYWSENQGVMVGECFKPNQFTFPSELLRDFTYIKFKGVNIRVPKRYKELLKNRYGNWEQPVRMGYH